MAPPKKKFEVSIRTLPFPGHCYLPLITPCFSLLHSWALTRRPHHPQLRLPEKIQTTLGVVCCVCDLRSLDWNRKLERLTVTHSLSLLLGAQPELTDFLFSLTFFSLNQWFLSSGMHQLFWDVPLGNSCKVLRIWALEGQENVEFILSHMCCSLQSNHFCYNRVGQGSVPFYN